MSLVIKLRSGLRRRFLGLKNHLSLILIIGVLLQVGSGCTSTYEYKGSQLEPPMAVPDFELRSANGQPFRLSGGKGKISLVFFGYTSCPDVCPLTLADVKKALAELEPVEREQVQVIFISADPERDTPEVLSRYMAAFDPAFIGLTDDFEKVQDVMKPFGAFAEKEEAPDSKAGYLVSHTARLYLLNANREILLTYPFGFEPEDLQSDLAYLLRQEEL